MDDGTSKRVVYIYIDGIYSGSGKKISSNVCSIETEFIAQDISRIRFHPILVCRTIALELELELATSILAPTAKNDCPL